MTSEQVEAFLAQAGLDAGAVGAAERLLLPEPQVDEARTARTGAGFAAGGLDAGLLHVRSDGLSAAGIEARFDEDARTLVLSAREDSGVRSGRSSGRHAVPRAGGSRVGVRPVERGRTARDRIDRRARHRAARRARVAEPIRAERLRSRNARKGTTPESNRPRTTPESKRGGTTPESNRARTTPESVCTPESFVSAPAGPKPWPPAGSRAPSSQGRRRPRRLRHAAGHARSAPISGR